MKLALALAAAFSVSGAARAEQYKALPVKSYVLTEPDGTPRYLVQHSDESNFRRVYYVKPVKSANSTTSAKSSPPQRRESYRRPAPKKRYIWPTSVM